MNNKLKLNAAQVIKHMSENELKQYKIQLEKEGGNPPSVTISDLYQFMQSFYKEFKALKTEIKDFKEYVINKFDQYDKLFRDHKWIK